MRKILIPLRRCKINLPVSVLKATYTKILFVKVEPLAIEMHKPSCRFTDGVEFEIQRKLNKNVFITILLRCPLDCFIEWLCPQ